MPAPTVLTPPPTPKPAARPGKHWWWCWECVGPAQQWRDSNGTDWQAAMDRHLVQDHGHPR